MEKKYKIVEIFDSIQGEGPWQGRWCVFVRFAGCNLSCSFCDTDVKVQEELQETVLVERVKEYSPRYIVLTGGEPCLQINPHLMARFHRLETYPRIAVETNGTVWTDALLWADHVTVSPKNTNIAPEVRYHKIQELRMLCGPEGFLLKSLIPIFRSVEQVTVSPIFEQFSRDEHRVNEAALQRALKLVEAHPEVLRLSVQLHKLIGVR